MTKCEYIGGCGAATFWASLFIVPFLYIAFSPSNAIIIDQHGNIDSIPKNAYAMLFKHDFYAEQLLLIDEEIKKISIDNVITRADIEHERFMRGIDETTNQQDYRIRSIDDMNDSEVADIIMRDRNKRKVDYIAHLTAIKKYLQSN